jgi:hypothetical protein
MATPIVRRSVIYERQGSRYEQGMGMTNQLRADPNVDRMLGELWVIADTITIDLRSEFGALREEVASWEPRPMPAGWR